MESDTGSYRMSSGTGSFENGLLLSPNPTLNNLTIQVYYDNARDAELLQLEVINITGKIVVAKSFGLTDGKYNLDTSLLSEGVYLLKITTGNHIFNSRFVKLK
jgi:hypothetical protein